VIQDWLTLVAATFAALLPIANPFSTAPVFAAVTAGMTNRRRLQQARLACIYTFAVLTVALLAGALILTFFGISIHALRVAGGLIVARIGFGMLNPSPEQNLDEETREEAMDMQDIAFTPIAMPMLSGPGSIAVTIGMATEVDRPFENLAIIAGIALVALTSWLILRSSVKVVTFMGATGVNVLTRIMGLLLVGIGIQFVAAGVFQALVSDEVMGPIVDAVRRVAGS
jgi:multiple antibiotic resistance protein